MYLKKFPIQYKQLNLDFINVEMSLKMLKNWRTQPFVHVALFFSFILRNHVSILSTHMWYVWVYYWFLFLAFKLWIFYRFLISFLNNFVSIFLLKIYILWNKCSYSAALIEAVSIILFYFSLNKINWSQLTFN